jgi:hypothetical protein
MEVSFIVTVENLSSKKTRLSLADRIPVSENRDIKVDKVKIVPAVRPDSRGILDWKLALAPKEKRQFRISYRVEYPAALVLEARRRRAAQPPSPAASPMKPGKYRIEDQLADLEAAL